MNRRRALGVLAAALVAGCASGAAREGGEGSAGPASARDHGPRVEDAFDGPPDLLVALRPARIARDPLYGPLLRRASLLASAHVGLASSAGTTALAAIERADEVIVGIYDPEARDAVVAVRGVPADVDPARIVDTERRPLWIARRELPGGVLELAPVDGADVALFALPRRAWVVATGAASLRARAAFAEGARGTDAGLASLDPSPLAVARLRGDAILRARPALAQGPLGAAVFALDHVTASLEPGPQGQVGEVIARFVYADDGSAARAEGIARDVVAAFTRKYGSTAPWLHAIGVARTERVVVVRGRIPRAWADGLLHLDLDAAP